MKRQYRSVCHGGGTMRRLAFWVIVLLLLLFAWAYFVPTYTAVSDALQQEQFQSVCNKAVHRARQILQTALSWIIGVTAFFKIEEGKIDEGFATLISGLAVLLAAYVGFAAPAHAQRKAERQEAKAIVQALAEDINTIIYYISHALPHYTEEFTLPNAKKFAKKTLPHAHAFQAFVDRVHLIVKLNSGPDLLKSLLIWHAYADRIREQQTQLVSLAAEEKAAPLDDNNETKKMYQSTKDLIRNLTSRGIWKSLMNDFQKFDIELSESNYG